MSDSANVLRILGFVLAVANVLALAGGLALLLAPRRVVEWLGSRGAHPVSLRRLTKPLEKYFDVEGPMLRYSRLLGLALLAGGAFVLLKWLLLLTSGMHETRGALLLAQLFSNVSWPMPLWAALWNALSALVLLGSVLAMIVGTLALLQSRTLKHVSKLANRWVSTRQATKRAARPYYGLDRWIAARPQAWGMAIALVSLYTLVMIVWFSL